jgi:hypothetical protein
VDGARARVPILLSLILLPIWAFISHLLAMTLTTFLFLPLADDLNFFSHLNFLISLLSRLFSSRRPMNRWAFLLK